MGRQSKSSKYDVGYGKPPQDHQWVKGQSGNPSGKRKAKRTKTTPLMWQLADQFNETVEVNVAGKKRTVNAGEAVSMATLRDILSAPLKDKLHALKVLKDLGLFDYQVQKHDFDDLEDDIPTLSEDDRRLLEIVERDIYGTCVGLSLGTTPPAPGSALR